MGPNGEHIKDKARFVVCGNYALEIDPNDTYASTAAINTLKIALSVAAIKGLTSSVMDIGNAFVCSEMTDEEDKVYYELHDRMQILLNVKLAEKAEAIRKAKEADEIEAKRKAELAARLAHERDLQQFENLKRKLNK